MSTTARTILVATDADAVVNDVDAALSTTDTTLLRVRSGSDVVDAVNAHSPDLVVLDLQIGNMGGVATALALRNEESFDRVEPQRVLMLLDRLADVFLARRAEADGWLIKPLDALRLRRAADAVLAGESYTEGEGDPHAEPAPADEAADEDTAEISDVVDDVVDGDADAVVEVDVPAE